MKETMTSRERWLAVMRRERADRVPVDFEATGEAVQELLGHLGLPDLDTFLRRYHIDRPVCVEPRYVGPPLPSATDEFGCRSAPADHGTGVYYEVVSHPLASYRSVEEIEASYRWPSSDWYDFSVVPGQLAGAEERPVFRYFDSATEAFFLYIFLRGREQAYLDLLLHPDIAHCCLERIFALCYEKNLRLYETIPGRVDFTYISEDFGSQTGLLLSLQHIREFLLPGMKRLAELARQAGSYVYTHSDGAIREVIPDLIAIGVDMLDPIQWRCAGMERAALKRDFGDRLVFHGAMDNQQTLAFGTPDQVRAEVAENLAVLGQGGGYILAPCHALQAVGRPENAVAMYEAAQELGRRQAWATAALSVDLCPSGASAVRESSIMGGNIMQIGALTAGVSEVELRPPLGLTMGDGAPQAKGFLTPLHVKALVLANGHTKVALVTLDMLGIDREDALRAAALCEERSGVPASSIIMTCSHTHVAPSMLPTLHIYREAFNPLFDETAKRREREWVEVVIESIARAVTEADAAREEASVGVVVADLPWLIFNRRRLTRNYGAWTHWMGIPKDQVYGVEGPIDPEFLLLVVRDALHRPLCLTWNFTGHNSFHFGDQYSADLAYTVQAAVDEGIGRHVPCLYAPACSGNTNYFDFGQPGGLEKATEGVTSAIMAIHRDACTLPAVALGGAQATIWAAERDTTRYWWKSDIERKMPGWREYGQQEVDRFQREGGAAYPMEVTALRIGPFGFIGVPAEAFVEFGLMIKQRSPFRHTFVASYANGYAGYVATRRAFMGGSYEVWPALNARVGREGGYLMADKAVELLGRLYG